MNTLKARFLGALFILPMLFFGLGSALIAPALQGINSTGSALNSQLGALLVIANSITVIGIGLALLPILMRHSSTAAMSYLIARATEGILLIVGLVATLAFATINDYSQLDLETHYEIGSFVTQLNHSSFQISMISLGLGSIPMLFILHTTKLVSRMWTIWGAFGYGLLVLGSVAELLGFEYGVAFSLPGGLFELCFGTWLILINPNFSEA